MLLVGERQDCASQFYDDGQRPKRVSVLYICIVSCTFTTDVSIVYQ